MLGNYSKRISTTERIGVMKRYVIEIVINEGSDEFFDELARNSNTGCDDIVKVVEDALGQYGLDENVKLVKYTNT